MTTLLTPAPFETRLLLDRARRYWERRRSLLIRQYHATFFPQLALGIFLVTGFSCAALMNWGISWQYLVISGSVIFAYCFTMYPEYSSYTKDRQRIGQILAQGICRELRVQATQVWEYEPSKEFGACFAFEQDVNRVIVITGWDFFDAPRFPNTEFLLVCYAELDSILNAMRIVRRGITLQPTRFCEACLDLPSEQEPAYCFNGDLVQFHHSIS